MGEWALHAWLIYLVQSYDRSYIDDHMLVVKEPGRTSVELKYLERRMRRVVGVA